MLGGLSILEMFLLDLFNSVNIDVIAKLYILAFAVALICVGLIDAGFLLGLKECFTKLKRSRSGLGWQLAVFVALLIAMPIAWFIASWPSEITYEAISDIYTFQGIAATVVDFARILIAYLVVVGLFLAVIWLWVNVNRKGDMYQ